MSGFHNTYRPSSLRKVIGHAEAVGTLSSMSVKDRFPSAILLSGPTGCGKTTLARAFASDVNEGYLGTDALMEMNMGDTRSIEDIRSLISLARLRPMKGKRRFIIMDEAHQLLSNAPAANAFLKPLEEPVPTTTYILCSMEPERFGQSTTGKALRGRCVHIKLAQPSTEEKRKFAARIAKAEGMQFEAEGLTKLAENTSGMRDVAMAMESLFSLFGTESTPSEEDILAACSTDSSEDQVTAVNLLRFVYAGKTNSAIRVLASLKKSDGYGLILSLLSVNWYVLQKTLAKGGFVPGLFGSKDMESLLPCAADVPSLLALNEKLVRMRLDASTFSIDERYLIASALTGG